MSGGHRRDNVEPIPVRMDLPPEIAALALPQAEGDAPIVILNASEKSPRTVYSLLRDAFVGAAIAWIAGRSVVRWLRNHHLVASTLTATATSVAVVTGATVLHDDQPPAALPQHTITIVASQSPVTISAIPALATITTKFTPEAISTEQPEPTPTPTRTRTSSPTAHGTSKPTIRPTARRSSPASELTPPPDEDIPAASTPVRPSPSPEQPPTTPPPAAEEPASTNAAARCAVRIDLDPLLDLCVLS